METPAILKNYIEAWSNGDVDLCIAPFGADGTYCDPTIPKPTLVREPKRSTGQDFSLRFQI